MALDITFVGIKPNGKCFDFSVVNNAKVDVINFILTTPLDSVYTLQQLSDLNAYIKVESGGGDYIDKISATSTYDSENEKLKISFSLRKKTTSHKNIALQLQFEDLHNEVISQTEIVALSLRGTINADKEISDKFPYAIQILEGQVEELANEVNGKVDKVSQANKVYGTDENGEQTTYDKNAFGQVEDVKVNDVSVVQDKVAKINLTPYEEKSNKTTLLSAQSTDEQYPSAKCVYNEVKPIKDVIPVQASSENQLADKDFVNSSIATNTAYFKGTFNVVDDLHLTISATHEQVATALASAISNPTNNDYAFVSYPDATEPNQYTKFERYKYSSEASAWAFEFELNNSSFTANQWASINSGITAQMVSDMALKSANNKFSGSNTFDNGITTNIIKGKSGTTNISITKTLRPETNGDQDLGLTNRHFKEGFIDKITDAKGSYDSDNTVNTINAVDIVNNTLTQEQFDLITNGKPTLIMGTLLSRTNIFLVSYGGDSTKQFIGFSGTLCETFLVNTNTLAISKEASGTGRLSLQSIVNFNGKNIPSYPSYPSVPQALIYDTDNTLKYVDTPNKNISDAYDNTKTYAVGDTCIYNNVLYKCTTAITTAEDFDATHWTATTVAELVADETIIRFNTAFSVENTWTEITNSDDLTILEHEFTFTEQAKVDLVITKLTTDNKNTWGSKMFAFGGTANSGDKHLRTVRYDYFSANTSHAIVIQFYKENGVWGYKRKRHYW